MLLRLETSPELSPHFTVSSCERMSHHGDTNEIFMRLGEMLSLLAPMACHIAQESLGSGKELSLAPLNLRNLRFRDVTAQWVASEPLLLDTGPGKLAPASYKGRSPGKALNLCKAELPV